MTQTENRRTALYDQHVALGGRMVPFAGFDMPVQYAGILKEHDAVRHRAGLFDLSHMAQFDLAGDAVGEWADRLTINHVATMKPWQARYNIFTNEQGGAHDDVLFYRLADRWMLVVNAGNADKMWRLVSAQAGPGVTVTNRHRDRSLVAIQGPQALNILAPLVTPPDARERVAAMKYYTCMEATVAGVDALIARTGYTGEDGFEVFVDNAGAARVWNALLDAGRPQGLEPAGLGARDVLRLEAGMPLYGHELTEEISPLAAGQSWAVKFAKPEFTGKAALEDQAARDDYDRTAGIVLEGRAPAREGYGVFLGDERVGEVKSASVAPAVGNKNIATVYVRKDAAQIGAQLGIEIRGTRQPARVVPMPFYKRAK